MRALNNVHATCRSQSGFTLLELIITLLMGTIIVGSLTQFYISQHYQVTQQMDVAEVQQSLRAAMTEVTDQLRMAGYGMPSAMDPIVAANSNPDTILFFYRRTPDSRAELNIDMADPLAELDCTGFDLSDFQNSTWAYIFDPTSNTGEFFYMSSINQGSSEIRHPLMPLSKSYPQGSEVIAVEIYRYYLDQTDAQNPVLVRSRQGEGAVVYAEGIDSLQFSYQLTSGAWSDAPANGRLIRAVQIRMVAIGRDDSEGVVGGVRQRALTNRVNIRNLGL